MIVLVVIIVKRGQTDLYYIQNQNSVDSLRRERATKKKKTVCKMLRLPIFIFQS